MKLEQSFEVQAPPDRVWAVLTDLASVAPCLPGAELSEAGEDGGYAGTFTVKLGPTTASYRGHISFQERDDDARRAVMHAAGQDKRGQGGATATMVTTVEASGGKSNVNVTTDLLITGKLARFGRGGMIEDISNRLLADFASCLQAKLAEPGATTASAAPAADAALAEVAAPPPVGAPPPASAPPPGASGPADGRPEPPPSNTISGAELLIGALPGLLRRNAPAIGGALALLTLARWRRRRRRRRPPGTETETKTETA